MNYVGIDIHKRYSVCATQDDPPEAGDGCAARGLKATRPRPLLNLWPV